VTERKTWPSVPKALADALYTEVGAGSTRLTHPLEVPAVQVRRIGGGDDGFTDSSRVDVLVIADDEESAEQLAEQVRSFLVDKSPIRGAGLLLDGATTEVAPYQVPWTDSEHPERTAFLATYVATSRRF
jgi:hypothetical protein